jgi:hypothetical protein
MALSTTTLSSACGQTDASIAVTSATGFAAGNFILIDQEVMQVVKTYVSGTTIPVIRGLDGSKQTTHVKTANVVTGLATDEPGPQEQNVVQWPEVPGRDRVSYSAAGAITLPRQGSDMVAIINGTSALAMTVAAPTTDMDGSILMIISNGKAAHTISLPAGIGLGAGGSGVDVGTFTSASQQCVALMAANGAWVAFPSFFGGTSLGSITVTWA